ncbi:hypothetical protein A0H81_02635 [Grifola frondosa]|uniref:Uncharacterized protein n=1 Tax=Grifola frondosa TaxID=5627 RepID=A0A1C7MNI5_GRIFR|nr:hypothetical protein A0H81_02635 [Grifola frondosa]
MLSFFHLQPTGTGVLSVFGSRISHLCLPVGEASSPRRVTLVLIAASPDLGSTQRPPFSNVAHDTRCGSEQSSAPRQNSDSDVTAAHASTRPPAAGAPPPAPASPSSAQCLSARASSILPSSLPAGLRDARASLGRRLRLARQPANACTHWEGTIAGEAGRSGRGGDPVSRARVEKEGLT